MKRISYLLGFMLCSFAVAAQSISVQLVDKNNGNTIPFAYIHMVSSVTNAVMNTVQTDENGNASLIPEQYPFSIEINAIGFESVKKTFPTPPAGKNFTIYMSKKFSSLNEVVITGLNTPMRQKDALSMYKIITKEQIQAQGAITLNEVMKNQLNVTVANDNILGSSMKIQGLAGNKVKILVDGLPLNGREDGNINLSQINMNNVDRIEIIQGPMSVVYGTDALGGIINIITKKETQPFAVNVTGYYQSTGKYTGNVSITKRIDKRNQLTLGGGSNVFQGLKPISQYRIYNNDTLFYQRSLLFKPNTQYLGNFAYTYSAPSGFNVRFASDYLNEKVVNKGNLEAWDPFNGAYANDEYYHTQRSMNRLSLNGKLGKNGTWQSLNGYMLYYRTRNSYKKDMVTLNQELNPLEGMQDTSSFSDVYARGGYSNKLNRFSYTVGYDINLQFAYSLKLDGKDKTIQDYAAYTSMSYELLKDKLKVQGGLRGAINSRYDPPLIPSLNLMYTPTKKVQIRASYTEGYRAPSLKEMYLSFIDLNHHILGNENLTAEKSTHFQLSSSYQAYENGNDYMQLIFTGYYNNVFNGITLAPTHPEDSTSIDYTYANLSHQTNTIASLQADGQYKRLHYQIGYSYNYTFADPGNYDAFSASEATATLQYAWKKPGIDVNVFYKLTGKQSFLQSNIDGSATFNGIQNAYHLCDVSFGKKFMDRKLQVVAGIKNLFDFQQTTVTGRVSSGGGHGGTGGTSIFMPRSFFTSLRLTIN